MYILVDRVTDRVFDTGYLHVKERLSTILSTLYRRIGRIRKFILFSINQSTISVSTLHGTR